MVESRAEYSKIRWDILDNDTDIGSAIYSDTYRDYQVYDHEGSDFEDSTWYDRGISDDNDWDDDSFWDSDDDWDWGSDDYDYDYGGGWDSDYSDWDDDW